jgi:hypothetical protein
MECVVTSVVEKRLGALPVAAEFLRRLDVAGTVDRLCPGRDIAHLTHGQVIETWCTVRTVHVIDDRSYLGNVVHHRGSARARL